MVEQFLERDVGIPRGTYVMKNGSGLNDANRFSATQLNQLLRHMVQRFPFSPEYLSSVPIAGKDGTLKYRFEGSDAVGRLRAKTGTLESVSALSGYVTSAGGERFTFSIMANDFAGRAGPIVAGLDALGAAVAATGSSLGPSTAVAALADSGRPSGAVDDVAARIKTYLELGAQRDQRNIGFLRTAWRSERDPAVRAVLAESLYQSNPHDYLGARTLLDSYSATAEVYGRLKDVARVLSVEVPGVSSMVELAAGGNAEALARVLELAGAAGTDAQAQSEMAEALSGWPAPRRRSWWWRFGPPAPVTGTRAPRCWRGGWCRRGRRTTPSGSRCAARWALRIHGWRPSPRDWTPRCRRRWRRPRPRRRRRRASPPCRWWRPRATRPNPPPPTTARGGRPESVVFLASSLRPGMPPWPGGRRAYDTQEEGGFLAGCQYPLL